MDFEVNNNNNNNKDYFMFLKNLSGILWILKWIIIIIIIIIIIRICWLCLRIAIWNSFHFSSCSRIIRGLWSSVLLQNHTLIILTRRERREWWLIYWESMTCKYLWLSLMICIIYGKPLNGYWYLLSGRWPINYCGLIPLPSSACYLFLHDDYHFIQLQKFLWVTRWRSCWGTTLQVGRSRFRFSIVSLEFFIDI